MMVKNATIRVTLRDGGQLSFVNAQAEEGNGMLTIFKTRDPQDAECTATILASLDCANIENWRIDESEPG